MGEEWVYSGGVGVFRGGGVFRWGMCIQGGVFSGGALRVLAFSAPCFLRVHASHRSIQEG
jgi:hypothetical protein